MVSTITVRVRQELDQMSLARSHRDSAAPPPRARSASPAAKPPGQGDLSRRLALDISRDAGRPLDPIVRHRMQATLGSDFGDARIHTGEGAATATREVDARALTIGNRIAFAPGQFHPGSAASERLLAHELAHVAQGARPASDPSTALSDPSAAAEREADAASLAAVSGTRADPGAGSTAAIHRKRMADAPSAELKALSVPSTRVSFSSFPLDDYFKVMSSGRFSMSETPPSGVTIELEGIADTFKTPMTSVAMKMADTTYPSPSTGSTVPLFGPGLTIMVNLGLAKYGLTDGDYRFTWTGDAKKGTVYIETPTAGPAAQNTSTATKPATDEEPESEVQAGTDAPSGTKLTVGSLSFSLASEWTAGRFAHLQRALALVPLSALKVVDGLSFEVDSSGSGAEDGEYDIDKHRVTMYSSTWNANAARYGGSEWPVYAIAHEIGHAVDRSALRKAWSTYQGSSGSKADEKKLTDAKTESGGGYVKKSVFELEVPLEGKDGDFRKAAAKDGVKLPKGGSALEGTPTEYAKHDWEDVYAESFALYTTDPKLLELIRPKIYAYFAKKYPRKP
jgi:Domain of unknown function (DUF4157)